MAYTIYVNGNGYPYPETGDTAWGNNATEFAKAVGTALSLIGLGQTVNVNGSIVKIDSTTQGIYIPRVATGSLPAGTKDKSLLLYNSTNDRFEYWNGSSWAPIAENASGDLTVARDLTVTRNLTVDTDVLKTDATNNRVGINTASPTEALDVTGNTKISGNLTVDTNTLIVDATNNRVGIVTASPTVALDVTGDVKSSGKILSADGTALAPSIAFSADLDTGIYRIGVNDLGIAAGGVKVAEFDSNGITANFPYWHLVDQKASGTEGGTITSGAWRTRTLNTTIGSNTITGSSLASSQFTLPTGTYRIFVIVPGYTGNRFKGKLRNITDSSDTLIGSSEYSVNTGVVSSSSFIIGIFTITAQKTFEIQHQVETTSSIYGGGVNSSFGVNEIYTQVWLWKLA